MFLLTLNPLLLSSSRITACVFSFIVVKSVTNGEESYSNLKSETVTESGWTKLKDNYLHQSTDSSFLYIKGPLVNNNDGVDYYIDDFSLVKLGNDEVDFTTPNDIVDVGAYEYSAPLSTESPTGKLLNIIVYPNPVKDVITLINLNGQESISVHNILGKKIKLPTLQLDKSVRINVSSLKTGIYFVSVLKEDGGSKTIQIIKK